MKNTFFLFSAFLTFSGLGQNNEAVYWSGTTDEAIRLTGLRQIIPQQYKAFHLNAVDLKGLLSQSPNEKNVRLENSGLILTLPLPNGEMQKFKVVESPIMEKPLYDAYPNIRTYSIKGVDDVYANGKLDWNDFGFHASVRTPNGSFFIDPYCVNNTEDYISYYTRDFAEKVPNTQEGPCVIESPGRTLVAPTEKKYGQKVAMPVTGTDLFTYRLAVACTGEYAVAATGIGAPSVSQVLSKIVTSVNRVDGVYETEVAVRLVLVATETLIVYTSAGSDPFTGNFNAGTLINESQSVITASIGTANFDIGHTFSTGGGGLAQLGCVCSSSDKASGITGAPSPVGDPYDIDYVAHEIGHQFDGNHTFNANSGSCSGNRNGPTSMEPGSGVTIMGYAGICGSTNNLANNSIAYFHGISFDEIASFVQSGGGSGCAQTSTTGNAPPLVSGAGNYTIPKATAFVLSGGASDADPLTYSWEEFDPGASGGNWNSGNRPFFRSYTPTTTATRYFPQPSIILTHSYTGTKGEYVPQTAQALPLLFRLTARDNKPGGGGVAYAYSQITVDGSGPFLLTYPNTTGITWYKDGTENVQWSVNGTDVAPVDCDTVIISISYDNGSTYTVLNNSTPNDGNEIVAVPTLTATIGTCRLKIQGKGNVFLDVSNNQFTVSHLPQGIKTNSAAAQIPVNIWPNPSNGNISVTAGNLDSRGAVLVRISDVLGKTIMVNTYYGRNELHENVDLSFCSPGLYFVEVKNAGRSSVHKIVRE